MFPPSDPTLTRLSEPTWWSRVARCCSSSWPPPLSPPPSSCLPSSRTLSVSEWGWEWPWLCFVCKGRPCYFCAINPRVFSHEKHDHVVHKYEKFIRNYYNWEVLEKMAFKVLYWKKWCQFKNKKLWLNLFLLYRKERISFKGFFFYQNSTIWTSSV